MGIVVVAVDRAPESWVRRIRTKVDERCQKVPWPIGEQPLKAAARASIAEKHLHVDSIECLAKSLQSVYRGFGPGEGGNSTSFGLGVFSSRRSSERDWLGICCVLGEWFDFEESPQSRTDPP